MKTPDELLTDEKLKDLFADGASRYWLTGPKKGDRNVNLIMEILNGNRKSATIKVEAEDGTGLTVQSGVFTKKAFKEAFIAVAVMRFLEDYDSTDMDNVLQYAVFGDLLYG